MADPHGTPVWYELMTPDPDGAKRFYDDVVGWQVSAANPGDDVDYRMIAAPGGLVGGVLKMDAEMTAAGAPPAWVPYFGVDDADAAFAQARELGARAFVPPTDVPNVGRFAFLADPQGAAFYVMRGASEAASTVFAPGVPGRCGWNELWTHDVAAAMAFYGPLLGFENRETMESPMGGYHFIDLGEVRIGAAAAMKDQPCRWNLYFTAPAIGPAVERIRAGGGEVRIGPYTTPRGEQIVLGADPQGAAFALVAPA